MRKTTYFTQSTIDSQSKKFLDEIKEMGLVNNRSQVNKNKIGLLVLDMQKYFLDPKSHAFIPSGPAIVRKIDTLVQVFKENKRPIFFTKHQNSSFSAGMMEKWWNDLIQPFSEMAELIPEIDNSIGKTITKENYDAFLGTSLELDLRSENIEQIVICGVMTHLCCESTARAAFMRNFEVFFMVDATATYSEQFHFASLLNLSHGFAKPVLSAEVINSFKQ